MNTEEYLKLYYREPEALTERPPQDRYCDLVLNGGVASGVVYPWAIIELARQYRFRSIGGTSVGAVAAALTAASEYGRRMSVPYPFEVLRQVPLKLAEPDEAGRTKMLRLFQTTGKGRRLFDIFVFALRVTYSNTADPPPAKKPGWLERLKIPISSKTLDDTDREYRDGTACRGSKGNQQADSGEIKAWKRIGLFAFSRYVCEAFAEMWHLDSMKLLVAPVTVLLLWLIGQLSVTAAAVTSVLALALIGVVVLGAAWHFLSALGKAVLKDITEGIAKNYYGLCTGMGPDKRPRDSGEQGFTEWLHEGIQRSAGFKPGARPLTFMDLWYAPLTEGGAAGAAPRESDAAPSESERSIDLQVYSSNLTFGAPLRLPMEEVTTRLFFDPDEWRDFFPASVVDYLVKVSPLYSPQGSRDPEKAYNRMVRGVATQDDAGARLRQLPVGRLPIVVATRMSMCFPILFSAIPLYAIDFESGVGLLKRVYLSDGGICSNFPIHAFDKPFPRWPTFGIYLDSRLEKAKTFANRLPKYHVEGRSDIWNRGMPDIEQESRYTVGEPRWKALSRIGGLLMGIVTTARTWTDTTNLLLPQTRNRVVRMALRNGEGELNLAMNQATILRMAHEYGTNSGNALVRSFAPEAGKIKRAWKDHLYIRANVLVSSLRTYLDETQAALCNTTHSMPIGLLGEEWINRRKRALALAHRLKGTGADTADPAGQALTKDQRDTLLKALEAVARLEAELSDPALNSLPYTPKPRPSLRMRATAT